MSSFGLPAEPIMDVGGVLIIGLYIKANLGAGPRDGLMLVLHQITRQRIAVTHVVLELTAATSGFLLGGAVGVGTLTYAVGIGPAVEIGFRVFRVATRTGEVAARARE
jgi:uncharacterized membrane protein YczE